MLSTHQEINPVYCANKPVYPHAKDVPITDSVKNEEPMRENEATNSSGYSWSTHDNIRCINSGALGTCQKLKRSSLFNKRLEKVVLAIFEKSHERSKENVCICSFEAIIFISVEDCYTREAFDLVKDKMHKLFESPDFI